jgi:hypothetical protein
LGGSDINSRYVPHSCLRHALGFEWCQRAPILDKRSRRSSGYRTCIEESRGFDSLCASTSGNLQCTVHSSGQRLAPRWYIRQISVWPCLVCAFIYASAGSFISGCGQEETKDLFDASKAIAPLYSALRKRQTGLLELLGLTEVW